MINKKVLLVGLGLATTTTLAGCINPLKPNVCLYGCPESFEHEENISEELEEPTSEEENSELDEPSNIGSGRDTISILYGCPMSSLSLINISEAESFNEDDLKIIIA